MTTPCCGNTYCKQCIDDCLKRSEKIDSCPSCRSGLSFGNLLKVPRFVTNILNKLEVHCDYNIYGCTEALQLGQLSQHLIQCSFGPKSPFFKCNQTIRKLSESINKLEIFLPQEDSNQLKNQLDVCQQEVIQLSKRVKELEESNKELKALTTSCAPIPQTKNYVNIFFKTIYLLLNSIYLGIDRRHY